MVFHTFFEPKYKALAQLVDGLTHGPQKSLPVLSTTHQWSDIVSVPGPRTVAGDPLETDPALGVADRFLHQLFDWV